MSNQIHPLACVSPAAELGSGNVIGPFAVIEADAILGDNNRIAAHAVIKAYTRMGNDNQVFEQAVIGGLPQDLSFASDTPTYVEIGSHNIFREAVTIHRATRAGAATLLGDHCYMMAYTHFAHDCVVGNHVILANVANVGGHVHVGDRAFLAGGVVVHQFCHIGRNAMIGGNTKVTQDVLPYMLVDGNPARVRGLNLVGLKRAGFSRDDLRALKTAFRQLFSSGDALAEQMAALAGQDNPHVQHLLACVQASTRGFHRH
ncbi:MAG: acyl-ACP--UDP-N-acetylglucosamine O-acyltransferase [Gammaproteobacteria bacterium]